MIHSSVNLVIQKKNPNDLIEQELMQAPDFFFDRIHVVDVLEHSEDKELINKVCNKLKQGGSLFLSGIDGVPICRQFSQGKLPLENFNNILTSLKRFNSLVEFKSFFIKNNWQINMAGYDNLRYYLEAIKK